MEQNVAVLGVKSDCAPSTAAKIYDVLRRSSQALVRTVTKL